MTTHDFPKAGLSLAPKKELDSENSCYSEVPTLNFQTNIAMFIGKFEMLI